MVSPSISSLLQDGGKRAALLLGGEDGALDQPRQIVEGVERLIEAVEIDGDLLQRLLLHGELEERVGIAARNAGTGVYLACHLKRLFLPNGRFSSRLVPGPEKLWDWRFRVNRLNPAARSPGSPRSL